MSDGIAYDQLGEKVDQLERRVGRLEKSVVSLNRALNRVEQKVFNGFGEKIDAINRRMDSVEKKVDENKADNESAHKEIKHTLNGMIKFGATSMILIFVALLTILGSLWFSNRKASEETERMEVLSNAPDSSYLVIE